ncbi:MAG: Eco57I restriction-modification methylase domain-containing protein, partial [Candidatus Helarchaeota archaeon]
YIVKNTVGELLKGKTPREAANIKIVDPACGSGSFLLGAFQYLMDWHEKYYLEHDPEKWTKAKDPRIIQTADGDWQLTTVEKKRILVNNLHGVDIDSQAVEVTKLSLLMKVLEEETGQLSLGFERALPDLNDNIKCGNSLIGWDYFEGQLIPDQEEVARVNPFDWEKGFPAVFTRGGFDAVIGNPPYIRIQAMKKWAPGEVEFFKKNYISASKGNYDIYVVFIEKGIDLLNQNGQVGLILPHKFFNSQYGLALRKLIAEGKNLSKIVHFGANQVFNKATTYTCLLFLKKKSQTEFEFEKVDDISGWLLSDKSTRGLISEDKLTHTVWNFCVGPESHLFEKLSNIDLHLGEIAKIFVGIQTSADNVFIMNFIKEDTNFIHLRSKSMDSEWVFEKALFYPIVSGTDVNRYQELPERQYLLFPYNISGDAVSLIDFKIIKTLYPKTAEYLLQNKYVLENRENGKMKTPKWYGYVYLKNMTKQTIKKICVPRLVDKLYATLDESSSHFLDNVDVGGITLNSKFINQGLYYILGIINSKLLKWYFPFISAPFRGGWLSANKQFISQLPIHLIDFTNSENVKKHTNLEALVKHMLDLHKRIPQTPFEQDQLEREIAATDAQIDHLVYDLYDLTEEEIKIVEEEN